MALIVLSSLIGIGGSYGVFLSADLFLLFVFYELVIVPKYFLIAIWGSTNKEYGAMAITAYGALAVLLATIVLREKVSAGQWLGIALIAVGVGYLGFAGA